MNKRILKKRTSNLGRVFNKISGWITRKTGSPAAFILAFTLIVLWAISGPVFDYSDTWQLVINTGTTIITFLMVFIIQQSQNRDTAAIHLKLNELIASDERASNRLVDIEDLTEEELMILKKFYIKLSEKAEAEKDLHSSHSLDETVDAHYKLQPRKKPPVKS
ncbi:low affinity iron permease family protein [Agriterribacter sp.]|mgnify:FL=1|uniref:low affinity iron permease family protein n=1 Tax=Agriterribacter sp. TaxID=2821509 RepID=UPI002C8AB885|nr:low affinity iron permease family protein [Agriterribacter sp.]HRP58158.1 low affinity iron permease family protein [Agriterribacter sp.]